MTDVMDVVRVRNLTDLLASGEVTGGEAAAARAELRKIAGATPPAEPAAPPHEDDRSNFLSGPVVQRIAEEIINTGRLARGEIQEAPRRLTGIAARMVEAAAKARGEVVDAPAAPTGTAAAILRAGAVRRGEAEAKEPATESARAAGMIVRAAARARGEAA